MPKLAKIRNKRKRLCNDGRKATTKNHSNKFDGSFTFKSLIIRPLEPSKGELNNNYTLKDLYGLAQSGAGSGNTKDVQLALHGIQQYLTKYSPDKMSSSELCEGLNILFCCIVSRDTAVHQDATQLLYVFAHKVPKVPLSDSVWQRCSLVSELCQRLKSDHAGVRVHGRNILSRLIEVAPALVNYNADTLLKELQQLLNREHQLEAIAKVGEEPASTELAATAVSAAAAVVSFVQEQLSLSSLLTGVATSALAAITLNKDIYTKSSHTQVDNLKCLREEHELRCFCENLISIHLALLRHTLRCASQNCSDAAFLQLVQCSADRLVIAVELVAALEHSTAPEREQQPHLSPPAQMPLSHSVWQRCNLGVSELCQTLKSGHAGVRECGLNMLSMLIEVAPALVCYNADTLLKELQQLLNIKLPSHLRRKATVKESAAATAAAAAAAALQEQLVVTRLVCALLRTVLPGDQNVSSSWSSTGLDSLPCMRDEAELCKLCNSLMVVSHYVLCHCKSLHAKELATGVSSLLQESEKCVVVLVELFAVLLPACMGRPPEQVPWCKELLLQTAFSSLDTYRPDRQLQIQEAENYARLAVMGLEMNIFQDLYPVAACITDMLQQCTRPSISYLRLVSTAVQLLLTELLQDPQPLNRVPGYNKLAIMLTEHVFRYCREIGYDQHNLEVNEIMQGKLKHKIRKNERAGQAKQMVITENGSLADGVLAAVLVCYKLLEPNSEEADILLTMLEQCCTANDEVFRMGLESLQQWAEVLVSRLLVCCPVPCSLMAVARCFAAHRLSGLTGLRARTHAAVIENVIENGAGWAYIEKQNMLDLIFV